MSDTVYVVRSGVDGGAPGFRFDDRDIAERRAAELNDEHGLPEDHTVHEEDSDD